MTVRPPDPTDAPSPGLVPVLVAIGLVTSVISSLGAPLLPTIARTDHVSLGAAQWALTVTMLSGAVTTPVLGRLGDGPARRPVILATLAAVVAGCAVAGLSRHDFALLVAGRALQGLGLGLMPLTMAVARDALPEARSAPVIALLSIATAAGVGLGYPVTGILEEAWGLDSPFWFGAVVAALALAAAAVVVPSARNLRSRPLDIPGALLLGGALVALLVAVSQGRPWGWGSVPVVGLLAGSVVLAVAWTAHERRTPHPLVDVRLLRHRVMAVTNLTAMLIALAIYMFFPLVTDFVQTPRSAGYGFGTSVVVTGLMLLPFSVLSTSMSRVAAIAAARFGRERVVPVGALVMGLGSLVFVVGGGALWQGFVAMGVFGAAVGCTFAAMPGLIVSAVPASETGSALGFYQVVRFVGFSLGSGVSASLLAAYTPAGRALPDRAGFSVAMVAAAGACVLAAAVAAALRSHRQPSADPKTDPKTDPTDLVNAAGPAAEVIFE